MNASLTDDPGVDVAAWQLKVSGAVARPMALSLEQLRALPRFTQITRHICIEGWAVIGSVADVRLVDVLRHVGVSPDARFIEFDCADDYYEFLDLRAATHPQTLAGPAAMRAILTGRSQSLTVEQGASIVSAPIV